MVLTFTIPMGNPQSFCLYILKKAATYFGRTTVLELCGLEAHLSDITESTVPGR